MEVTCEHTHELLAKLIDEMDGPPGWSFAFVRKQGAPFFTIYVPAKDNYDPSKELRGGGTSHEHPAPFATFNVPTWQRWLFDKCRASMDHEMGEMVRWGGLRPFAPTHGPGEDPYVVREYRDPIDALTTQNGMVRISHGSQQVTPMNSLSESERARLRQEMWDRGQPPP